MQNIAYMKDLFLNMCKKKIFILQKNKYVQFLSIIYTKAFQHRCPIGYAEHHMNKQVLSHTLARESVNSRMDSVIFNVAALK